MKEQKNPEQHSEKKIFITAQILGYIIADTIAFFICYFLKNLFDFEFNIFILIGIIITATAVCLLTITIPYYHMEFPKDNEDIQEQ